MGNKILLFIFASILLIGMVSASAKIAYVVKVGEDKNIVDFLNEKGYEFDIVHEKDNFALVNWDNYSAIIVGDGKFDNPKDIPVNKKPSLVLNTKDIDEWGWTKYSSASSLAPNTPPKLLVYKNNYITDGIAEFFFPYDKDGLKVDEFKFFFIRDYGKVNILVADNKRLLLSPIPYYVPKNGAVIFTIEKNKVLNKGIIANAKGVFFGITNTALWSSDTKKIFKNSIKWLIEGENKAPILKNNIPTIEWTSGETMQINLNDYFSDAENQTLTYGVYNTSKEENISLNINGSIVTFSSTKDWFGRDWIIFRATDTQGAYAISNNVTLIVLEKNISIPEIKINEFESNPAGGSEGQEWIELYNPNNNTFDISGWKIYDGLATSSLIYTLPASTIVNSKGFYVITLSATKLNNDNEFIILKDSSNKQIDLTPTKADTFNDDRTWQRIPDGSDNWEFKTQTKGLSNVIIVIPDTIPPIVELLNPANESVFDVRNVDFNFSASDNLAAQLQCQLYLNNNPSQTKIIINGTTGSFSLNFEDGDYFWNVRCSDNINRAFAPENWTFSINAPNAPKFNRIESQTVNESQTLTFTISATDPDVGDIIKYSVSNLPNGAVFNSSSGVFLWTPDFTQGGKIYSVVFTATDSTNLSTSMTVNINVIHIELPPSFEDADTCSVADSNISVKISKPRDGDDFEIGDEIKIRTEVENNGNEDVKFDVKAYLYDLDEDNVVEEKKDSVKIKKSDSEKVDFTITIPDDADTDDNFAIYVIAFKENNEFCNSNFNEIEIDKPDKKAVIKDFEVFPEEIRGNEKVSFDVEVENIGDDDLEDVYIEIKNSELGLNLKSDKFDLDSDDKDTISLEFVIPKNMIEKNYEIEASVVYDGESDKETKDLTIIGEIKNIPPTSGTGIISTAENVIYLDNQKPINLEGKNPIILTKTGKINVGSENIIVKEEVPEIKITLSNEEEKSAGKVEKSASGSEMIFSIFTSLGINAILIFGIVIIAFLIVIVGLLKR